MTLPIKSMKLRNGLRVHYRMGTEVEILEQELFADNVYFSDGISVEDGAIVFDVGANTGMFALMLSTLVRDATVYSFEPIPDIFELLALNAQDAKGIKIQPFNFGLSSEAKTVEFAYYPRNSMMSSMYPSVSSAEFREDSRRIIVQIMRRRGGFYRFIADRSPQPVITLIAEMVRRYYQKEAKVRCELRTLSQVIDQLSPPRIDLLKIDTEKSEFDILQGMRDEHWPLVRQVILEVHEGAGSVDRALGILRSFGFEAWSPPLPASNSLLANVYARRK